MCIWAVYTLYIYHIQRVYASYTTCIPITYNLYTAQIYFL